MKKSPIKILLLDDDPNLCGVLSDTLKVKGFEPIRADTAAAALARVEQQDIGVVLIGIGSEDMSGLEVLRSMKVRSPGTECIILTGHASQSTAREAVNLGAYSYFQKPYEVDQLLIAIQRAAEKLVTAHALQESESRFRSIIENSSDLICILNPDATLRYVSPSIERLLGYAMGDVVIGTALLDFIHPDDIATARDVFRQLIQSFDSSPVSVQLRLRHKDGTWRTLEGTTSNQLENPAIEGIIINARDVTERVLADAEIHRMVNRWSIIYRAGEEIGAGLDTEQVFTAVHRAVEQVMPCEDFVISLYDEIRNEMIGNYILENKKRVTPNPYRADHGLGGHIVHSGESLILNNPEQIKTSGIKFEPYGTGPSTASVVAVPLQLKAKTIGIISAQSYHADAFRAEDLELLEMLASHAAIAIDNARLFEQARQEIAERKRAEERITTSETELRALFASMHDVVLVIDRLGVYLEIAPTNPSLLAKPPEELLGKTLQDIFLPEQAETFIGVVQQVLDTKKTAQIEYDLTIGNRRVWFEASVSPMMEDRTLWVARDITERKQVEEDLLRSKEETAHANLLLLALNQAAQAVQRARTTGEVYRAIQNQLTQLGYFSTGFEISEDGQSLHIAYINYKSDLVRKAERATGLLLSNFRFRPAVDSIYHRAIVKGETVFVEDSAQAVADTLPRKLRSLARPITSLFKLGQSIFAPLMVGEEMIGIFAVTGPDISASDNPAIAAFANQAAIALQNARLYEQAQQEITERKQAEAALRKSESSLKAVLQSTADGILAVGSENEVLYANERFTEIWRIPQTVLASKDDSILLKHVLDQLSDPKSFLKKVQELYKSKEESFDTLNFKDGRVFERLSYPLMHGAKVQGRVWSFRDVTARNQAEDAKRQAEAMYRYVVEQVPAVFYTEAMDRSIIFVSPKIETILGYTPEEWMSKLGFWKGTVHPDDLEKVQAEDERTNQKGEPFQAEYRVMRKDGRMVWLRDQASLVRDHGKPLFWQGVMYDITAEKESETALRASEERYRMLAENMNDTIWLMDMSLRTTYISPSVTRLRGYTLDEINMIPLDQQMPPDSLQQALQVFAETLSPENLARPGRLVSRNIELEFYKKDGTKYWSENTFTLIRDPQGQPFAILGSGRDISERKNAQEALQNSEKYFRALTENNTDAVVLVDPRGLILYESPAYARLMGRVIGEHRGKSGYEFIHVEDRGPVAQMLNELVQHPGQIRHFNFRNQHKDGSWRWIEATATNLLGESAVHGLVINMHDITERKQAEVEIRRRMADLEVLYENGLSISVLLEPRKIARKMIEILSQKLDWHHAAIRLYHPETGRIELLALNEPGLDHDQTQAEMDRLNKMFASPDLGMSGWVVKYGKTIRSGDVQADKRYLPTFAEIRSGLYVPLMIGDRIIGSIAVESRQVNRFSEDDERLLQTLAAQSAIAFENAHLYQDAINAAKRKDALHQGGLEIVRAGQDVEALCLALHHAAQQVMQAEVFIVSLITADGLEVEAPYLVDRGIRHPNTRLPVTAGITGRVIKSKKPLRIKDVKKIRGTKPIMDGGTDPTRAILLVPLLAREKIVGAISVESREPDVYTAEDQIFMETLASEAAIAFENARLYQEAVSASERRAVLYRAGQEIAAAGLDLEQVYRSIHQAASQLMPLDVFTIVLADENQRMLHAAYLFDRGERFPSLDLPWGTGLVGYVISEKKALRVADYPREKPVEAAWFGKPGTPRSIISVPLNSGAKIVGVLSVQDYRPNIYGEEDEILLKTLAAYAGIAIENSRLFEETRRRLAELESLSQVSISLTSAIDLQPLLENILVGARNAIPAAEKGTILLTDTDSLLHLHAMSGYTDPRLIGLFLPDQNGYAARVAREQKPIKIDDAHTGYEIPYKGMIEEIDAVQSGIAAPLIVKGKVIGVISLDNASRKAAFSESDLRLLVTFASSAAVAIENARLFTETQQRLHRLTALHSVDAAIGASVDTHVTLNIVLENIMTELKADAAAVILFNPLTRMLEYAAGRGFRVHTVEGVHLRLGEGLAGQAALQRRAINIADLQKTDEVEQVMEHPFSGSSSSPLQYLEGEDFVAYHAIPLIAKGQIQGVLEIFRRSPMQVDQDWINFFEMLAGQTAIAIDNGRLFENLQQSNLELTLAYDATIQGWSQALELRDEETEGHTLRVTDLTLKLIQIMGLEEVETEHARRGALLHDIGKIAVPDSILLKPGPLDEREWSLMRQHPLYAYNLLSPITYLRPALNIPYCHHEKWDGSGYPRGLKGEEIPMVARIFAIVDVFDALTSNRPYRLAWTRENTLEYILDQSGKHFDPKVVKTFMNMMAG